jgi:4'-phosphopantetheinyl transferase
MPANLPHIWREGPQKPALPSERIDVWRLALDNPPPDNVSTRLAGGPTVLAPDELARAARFHFEKDRTRFSRCRAALRALLSRYLDLSPGDIRFTYSRSGKPEVSDDQNPHRVRFNVSHSENIALIAIGLCDNLGVDIEKVRPDVQTEELSERFFSARERASLRALPETLRMTGFYACWSRKEAFLKATGDGLGFPLEDFSVSVHPAIEPRLEEIKGDAAAARNWSLLDLHAAEDFYSAIAVERPSTTVATFALLS